MNPKKQEKHFIVTRMIDDDTKDPSIVLEAVHSKQEYILHWAALKDDQIWLQGWR